MTGHFGELVLYWFSYLRRRAMSALLISKNLWKKSFFVRRRIIFSKIVERYWKVLKEPARYTWFQAMSLRRSWSRS